jgi:hypothetical protein
MGGTALPGETVAVRARPLAHVSTHEKGRDDQMRPLFGARRGRQTLIVMLAASGLTLGMTGISQAAGPDPVGTIYVANDNPDAALVFAPGSNGDAIPERTITGPNTGLGGEPADIKVDSAGDIFVSNFGIGTITEYAPGASGDATPICTLGGSNTGLGENDDMSLEADGTLVVSTFAGLLEVFPPGSCGNVAPAEAISGSNTGLGLIDGVGTDAAGTIFAANTESSEISIFAAGANGNVPPENTITGSNTGLGWPDDVVVGFGGELYVTSGFDGPVNAVTVYAPGASGNATPTQDITGSNTDFGLPDDLAVDTSGNIFVTDSEATVGPALLEFASGATGNVAPIAAITGPNTGITVPEGTFIAGPPQTSSATMTTAVSASSIKLGGSVNDAATLTGGTTPTGSLVFKLFGPSDPTCSAAPAYVSPAQTVSGDGVYDSPTFMPTATGTYSWVAEYSGDSNNAPVTTACGDPKEQVTVTETAKEGCSISDVKTSPFTDVTTGNTDYAEDNLASTITPITFSNSAPEHLIVGGNGHVFTLTGLTDVSCHDLTAYPTGPGNKFNSVSGDGPGTLGTAPGNGKPGYTAHWEISDRGDQPSGGDTGGDTIRLTVYNNKGVVVWHVNGTFTTASQEEIG